MKSGWSFTAFGIVQVKEVKALIGYFDLDPKRVYDVVLEAYEHLPHQEAFLQLTGLFSQDARTQILGFRFARLANEDMPGCDALHQVTAQLIKVRRASSCIKCLSIKRDPFIPGSCGVPFSFLLYMAAHGTDRDADGPLILQRTSVCQGHETF